MIRGGLSSKGSKKANLSHWEMDYRLRKEYLFDKIQKRELEEEYGKIKMRVRFAKGV